MGESVEVGRLADLALALSLATDLGTRQPLEHGLRTRASRPSGSVVGRAASRDW